jgi:hypothetical protein
MSAADDPKPERRQATEPTPAPEELDASEERGTAEDTISPEDLPDEGAPLLDEVDVRELLRGALAPPPAAPPNLLRGVQRRLRTRSRGKFYADGWSTSRSPRSLYLATSLVMLALIAFVFLVLIPWGGGALP